MHGRLTRPRAPGARVVPLPRAWASPADGGPEPTRFALVTGLGECCGQSGAAVRPWSLPCCLPVRPGDIASARLLPTAVGVRHRHAAAGDAEVIRDHVAVYPALMDSCTVD